MINQTKDENRLLYLDILRIMAMFAVIILHISGQYWDEMEMFTYEWNILNIYDSCVRWSVPIFAMISGALFLGKDKTIKDILCKNTPRIVSAFFFCQLYMQ